MAEKKEDFLLGEHTWIRNAERTSSKMNSQAHSTQESVIREKKV